MVNGKNEQGTHRTKTGSDKGAVHKLCLQDKVGRQSKINIWDVDIKA